jgi:hypothetical protein
VSELIQSTLFFILGFLCAAFLALLVGPAVWRRAVNLTTKRIEASMPLTLNEMHAEADSVRAAAAMTIRRLEMNAKALNEKVAEQLVEINRGREELKRIADEAAEKPHRLFNGGEAKVPELHVAAQTRDEQIEALTQKLGEADGLIAKGASELEELGNMYEEVSFVSSSRQIELASAEAEIERLTTDMSRLRSQRKDADGRLEETVAENQALKEALQIERKRISDLEQSAGQMRTLETNREGPDEHHGRGPARSPSKDARAGREPTDGQGVGMAAARTSRAVPQAAIPDGSNTPRSQGNAPQDDMFAELAAKRDRLERQLVAFAQEHRKSRDGDGVSNGAAEEAALREQLQLLAAEIVSLTAAAEGAGSPIHKALADPSGQHSAPGVRDGALTSLADRVRALQKQVARD